jgi:hypothetical protein
MIQWEPYTAGNDDHIPIEQWGKDHWSTFAYIETRTVDGKGLVDNQRMRCNPRLHRELANISPFSRVVDGSGSPTRLKNGEEQYCHDDWSCVEDMVKAGLVTAEFRIKYFDRVFGGNIVRVKLTEKGLEVAAALRAHKANGGNFSNFEIEIA